MQLRFLRDLYAHMAWADGTVWNAVLSSSGVAEDESLQDTLVHLHLAQRAFLGVWQEEALELRGRGDFGSAEAICTWAQEYHESVEEFLGDLDETRLEGQLDVPWASRFEEVIGRSAASVTLGQSIYQVVSHSMYHRGQINRRLRELGGEPPLVDYIAWLWMGHPEPSWTE